MVAGAEEGRDRLRRRPVVEPLQLPEGRQGHHHGPGASTPASTRSPSTPVPPPDNGIPIGDGNPALKDKRVRQAIAYAIDSKTLVDKVLGGYGQVGHVDHPADLRRPPLRPGRRRAHVRPGQGQPDARRRRLHQGLGRHPREPGDGKQLQLPARSAAATPSPRNGLVPVRPGLAARTSASSPRSKIVSEDTLTEIIGNGEYDLFEWGWVVEPDPDYQLSTFTCAPRAAPRTAARSRRPVRLLLLQPGVRRAVRSSSRRRPTRRARRHRQADAEDALRRRAVRRDVLLRRTSRRTAATGSPTFRPQPDPKGSLLFQYGTYSYRAIKPVGRDLVDQRPAATGALGRCWRLARLVVLALARRSCSSVAPAADDRGRSASSARPPGRAALATAPQHGAPASHGALRRHQEDPGVAASLVLRRWCSTSSCSGCCPATRRRS